MFKLPPIGAFLPVPIISIGTFTLAMLCCNYSCRVVELADEWADIKHYLEEIRADHQSQARSDLGPQRLLPRTGQRKEQPQEHEKRLQT